MMRIGIFGGAFDPPHRGHERALEVFLEKGALDRVFVIPSGIPPHKKISGGAKDADRMEMARWAFSALSDTVCISDMEMRTEGKSYAYLTVQKLRAEYPKAEIILFVGTDQFLAFESWVNFKWILKECTLSVMDRFENAEKLRSQKERMEKEFGARCLLLEEKAYIISSTQIRSEIAEKGFSRSLSPRVNEYIAEHGIYSAHSDPERTRILGLLKEKLSPERISHTLAVEREVDRLCEEFSFSKEDRREMRLAALFHDLTKEISFEKQLVLLQKEGEEILKEDLLSPAVLHGKTAALQMKREGIFSEEVQSAVRYHTTGKENMTLRDKILYFADFAEETREHKICQRIRESFDSELLKIEEKEIVLDCHIIKAMRSTLDHLKEKDLPIHPLGLSALEDLENKMRKENL